MILTHLAITRLCTSSCVYWVKFIYSNCQTALADVEALEVSDCRYASSDSLTDNEIQNDIDSPEACGAYSLSNSPFTSCINANPELTTTFSAICEYDFCENYLTMTTDPDIMSSGDCLVTGIIINLVFI